MLSMMDIYLVSEKTTVSAKGDGAPTDLLGLSSRVILLTLNITNVIEQESLDVSIYGSADGTTWGEKPLLAFPQKFYRGEHPLLLDLSDKPDIKMLRAHWEVARWGRGAETTHFEFEVRAREVPAAMLTKA